MRDTLTTAGGQRLPLQTAVAVAAFVIVALCSKAQGDNTLPQVPSDVCIASCCDNDACDTAGCTGQHLGTITMDWVENTANCPGMGIFEVTVGGDQPGCANQACTYLIDDNGDCEGTPVPSPFCLTEAGLLEYYTGAKKFSKECDTSNGSLKGTCCFKDPDGVPAMSHLGLALMLALLVGGGCLVLRRRTC